MTQKIHTLIKYENTELNRQVVFENINEIMESMLSNGSENKQVSVFQNKKKKIELKENYSVKKWSIIEELNKELDVIGFYLTNHPISIYQTSLLKHNITSSKNLSNLSEEALFITLAGILIDKKERSSKKGDKIIFLRLTDIDGTFEVTLFSDVYEKYKDSISIGKGLIIKAGTKKDLNGNLRIIVKSLEELCHDNVPQRDEGTISINCDENNTQHFIKKILRLNKGTTEIILVVHGQNLSKILLFLPQKYHLTASEKEDFATFSTKSV